MSHVVILNTLVTCWVPLGTVTLAGQGPWFSQTGPGGSMCSESVYWMKERGSKCVPAQQCALMEHLLYARVGAGASFDLRATLRGRSSY